MTNHKGKDALLDEQQLADMLSAQVGDASGSERLQHAGVFLIMDAWDRNLTREEFMTALAAGMGLHSLCGKHNLLIQVFNHHINGTLDAALLQNTRAFTADQIAKSQADAVAVLSRIRQCATSDDVVH